MSRVNRRGPTALPALSRRERQLVDAVYQLGRATAREVMEAISDPPSYSAVRATLRLLEDKGVVSHVEDGPRYVYLPTVPRAAASKSALARLVDTFFGGSREQALAALIDPTAGELSDDELARMSALLEAARKEGR